MRFSSGVSMLSAAIVSASIAMPSFAQTGETYTLNVLGFQKLTIVSTNSGGQVLGSTPFSQEATNRIAANLDHTLGTNGIAGFAPGSADNVIMYNKFTQTYVTYWLSANPNPLIFRHWVGAGNALATNVFIEPGTGYWFLNRASSNVTVVLAGNVVNEPTVTTSIVPGLQMLSYPFSSPVRMTAMALTNGQAGLNVGTGDNIMLYEPTNQSFTTYWLSSNPNPILFRHWVGAGNILATNVFIQPGQGFWYLSRLSTTNLWIEPKPYTF